MRLKEFIIFIIIFTICYFTAFALYDYFSNKKALAKYNEKNNSAIILNKYLKFANFYGINTSISEDIINSIHLEIRNLFNINLNVLKEKYNLSIDEIIVIILFLEYLGLIPKRIISKEENMTYAISTHEENMLQKYSLFLASKFDYETITQRVGLNSDKELSYLDSKLLMPGIKLIDEKLYYVGDLDE